MIFSNCKFECGKNNSVSSHDKILKRQNYGDENVSYFFLVLHEFLEAEVFTPLNKIDYAKLYLIFG